MDVNLPTKLVGQVLQAHRDSRNELKQKIDTIKNGDLTIDTSHEIIQLEEALETLDIQISAIEYTYNYVEVMMKQEAKKTRKI